MHVVHEKDAVAQPRQNLLHMRPIELPAALAAAPSKPSSTRVLSRSVCSRPINHVPVLDKPFVIEVDRILRGKTTPRPIGARLLQQGQQRLLGRRIGHRREIAEDLIHVQQARAGWWCRTASASSQDLVQQQRDEKHPLGVAQMRDGKNRRCAACLPACSRSAPISSGSPSSQAAKSGRGKQIVELHRERETFFGGIESFEIQHAEFREPAAIWMC